MDAEFEPLTIHHRGTLRIPAPLARTFPCFTPEGERRWVPEWMPRYLPADRSALAPGTVFETDHGDEKTIWVIVTVDAPAGRATYARITPGSRTGTVTVACRAESPTTTLVTVIYRLTGATPPGNARLAAFDERAFAATLAEWEQRVTAALAEPEPATE